MPIFTAIGTAISAALFAGSALATSLISAGLSLAAKLALSYLMRPKKKAYAAVQGEVQLGGSVPAQAVYGKAKTRGHRIYSAHWGSGNRYRAEVLVLSNGWCDGLDPEIIFYGQKYVLTPQAAAGGELARYFVTGFSDKIDIRFYDGRPGQAADAALVAATALAGNPWPATAKATGLCYVIVTADYDAALFDKGVPEYEFVLRGLREYDPRYDSTVPGGSGAQRLASPSTWVWTQNPAIHRINYLLGLKGVLSGRTLIGVGMDVSQIDIASHMAAATVCDTTRTIGARTIPTYSASLIAQGDDDHIEILAELEDAMAGYSANMNGLSGVIPGAPQIVSATLTADDIRIDDVLDVTYRRSGQESVNILSGQFTSPEALWAPVSLATVTASADVTADGRKRPASNDFLQVTDPDIGQYLLNIRYRQNRKAGKASVPVSRRFGAKTGLGDWISWNGKTWLVSGRSFDERMRFRLDLAETGADIYSEAGITPGPVALPAVAPANPSVLSNIAGFAAEAGMIAGSAGNQQPSLRFTWTPPGDPTMTQVRVSYRVAGGADEFEAISTAPESGELITAANVLSGVTYEARATVTTVPDRLKTFTSWVTTGTTGQAGVAWLLDSIGADSRDAILQIRADLDDARARLEMIAADAARGTGVNIVEQGLSQRFQGATASALQSLSVSITGHDGELTALSTAMTAVEASVDDATADGLMKWEAVSSGSGGTAKSTFTLWGKAEAGGAYRDGGARFEVTPTTSMWQFFSDNFRILKPDATPVAVFGMSGSDLLINNAVIGVLGAEHIAAGAITAGALAADVATFVNAQIATATIDFAQIDSVIINEGEIAAGAITSQANQSVTTARPQSGTSSFSDAVSITVQSPSLNPVFIVISVYLRVTANTIGLQSQVKIVHNGVDIIAIPGTAYVNGEVVTIHYEKTTMIPVTTAGAQTLKIQTAIISNATAQVFSGSLIASCNKK